MRPTLAWPHRGQGGISLFSSYKKAEWHTPLTYAALRPLQWGCWCCRREANQQRLEANAPHCRVSLHSIRNLRLFSFGRGSASGYLQQLDVVGNWWALRTTARTSWNFPGDLEMAREAFLRKFSCFCSREIFWRLHYCHTIMNILLVIWRMLIVTEGASFIDYYNRVR